MKRILLLLLGLLLLLPAAFVAMQDAPALRLQITGINRAAFPTVIVNANVFDRVGQPVLGLGESNFAIVGELVDRMRVVNVENISDDSLSFSAVLAIDTSSSMAGTPLERAKEAAISFVNTIGPNDPVAIVIFDSRELLIQDFTTDKDLLISKISALGFGGQTALYDGGLLAVQTAANSPIPRRAIILLSDGAEFGGRSSSERSGALDEALRVGVPVYTIGQGFGFDRSYMQELASGTNAQFYESPTPDQLLEIYNSLASTLRSQYIITLESDLPGDGTVYPLTLEVTADGQTAQANTQLRAPIPVPIPSIVGLPAEPLLDPVSVVGDALSDDGLATGQFQLDNGEPVVLDQSPFIFDIDPAALSVGEHTLTFTATDTTGDTAGITQSFSVAAQPPVVAIEGLPQSISELTSVTINATALRGQIQSLIVRLNDQPLVSALNTTSTTVSIDPAALQPGTYTLSAVATDTDGSRTETTSTFEVAALPPTVVIGGLEDGQSLSEAAEVSIDGASAQFAVNSLIVRLNDQPLASLVNASSTTVIIDPATLPPGDNTLTAIARDSNNGRAEATVTFTVPAFPPRSITFSGLEAGETLAENRTIEVEVDSPQTPVTAVVYTLDGVEVLTQTEGPFTFDLDVAALGAGSHILSVTATNAGGQSASADTAFLVAEPPTPTATSLPPTATSTTAPGEPTNTSVPPTNTSAPEPTTESQTVDASPTAATQAQVATDIPTDVAALPPTDEPTAVAAVPTNTEVPPTNTSVPPTNTSVPPTNTSVPPTNTSVPPTNTRVPASATSTTIPPTDTVAPTDTTEATAEVTAEETAESTEAAAPSATNTTAATDTGEATAAATSVGTSAPTFTPIPLTAESQGTVGQAQSPLLIGATCLLGLLLLAVIYWFAGRRRSADRR